MYGEGRQNAKNASQSCQDAGFCKVEEQLKEGVLHRPNFALDNVRTRDFPADPPHATADFVIIFPRLL
ncbi:MAG: hypothetical protein CL912_22045 [Deltaproteobacteria bacterium]|nr:hypothetical protein [Deltaproteobacteria bacterium]